MLETHLDERTERYAREVAAAIDSVAPVREAFALGSAAVGGFDPATSDLDLVVVVDAVLLTHGHLDHIGAVPALIEGGFERPILATKATLDIVSRANSPTNYVE